MLPHSSLMNQYRTSNFVFPKRKNRIDVFFRLIFFVAESMYLSVVRSCDIRLFPALLCHQRKLPALCPPPPLEALDWPTPLLTVCIYQTCTELVDLAGKDRGEKRNTTSRYKEANGYISSIFCIKALKKLKNKASNGNKIQWWRTLRYKALFFGRSEILISK